MGPPARRLWVSHRIDRFENPPDNGQSFIETDSESGVAQGVKDAYSRSLQQQLDAELETGDEGADGEAAGDDHKKPHRVAWSSNDDDPTINAKRASDGKQKTSRPRKKRKDTTGTIVGLRVRNTARQRPTKVKSNGVDTDDEEEDEDWEPDIPQYVKHRRELFNKAREELETAGLMLPPDYDDVAFSDDERLHELAEKPNLEIQPCGPYKDIKLPYSLGIIPAPLAQWLRPYQVDGAAFLHEHFVYQKGGILGDDMGLGKTIQVVAFLTAAFGKTGDERDAKRMRKMRRAGAKWYPRVLIICPGSLMRNWQSELHRWGWWHVDVFHGSPAQKESVLDAIKAGRCEIMITTYSTYRLNKESLNLVEWDAVIADECHIIKGRHAEITKAMNEINALCRLGLTGTAIQNNYDELWTLLNWTSPGSLGPLSSWKTTISRPLKIGQSHDATVPQLANARAIAEKLKTNLLPNFFLRRMKTLIKDQLPKKRDRVIFCPLTPSQADAYENFCNSSVVEAIRTSGQDCHCGSGKKSGWCCHTHVNGQRWQALVFPSIMTMQKLANHLAMLIPSSRDPADKQGKDLSSLEVAVPHRYRELYRQRDNILHYANPEFCGKWRILKKLLTLWHANGDKVLVFSHSVRLLRMLETLFNTTTSFTVSFLSGALSYDDRARVVDTYNSDPRQFVFLISARAGGVGLNITAANKVVVVDPNWNPAHDLQAQDRAYRIGQTRDVDVFRLVSAGTVEEIVYARQIYKQQQANIGYDASLERRYFKGVQDSKEQKGEIFGLANLFAFHGENVVLQDIVNKTNIAESRAGLRVVGIDAEIGEDADLGFAAAGDAREGEEDEGQGDARDELVAQLSDLITDGGDLASFDNKTATAGEKSRQRRDAVQAILASAGVAYSHENSEVIGTSAAETRLSRRAQEAAAGDDSGRMAERVFASQQAGGAGDDDLESVDAEHEGQDGEAAARSGDLHARYRPPESVRRRHFCEMARFFGFGESVDGVTEFALVVESWTQSQRREALGRFYQARKGVKGAELCDIDEEL